MSDARLIEYLAEALALDPSEHSGRILELREQYRSGAPAAAKRARRAPASKAKAAATREELEGAIEKLRKEFYELDARAVNDRLQALELHDHPDLDRVRKRLARVNELRPRLDELAEDERADRAYVLALRRLLIASGVQATALRDQTSHAAGAGRRAKDAKRFATLVAKEHPELAALETDWLERMRHARRNTKDSAAVKGGIGCFGGYLILKLIVYLIEWIQRSLDS